MLNSEGVVVVSVRRSLLRPRGGAPTPRERRELAQKARALDAVRRLGWTAVPVVVDDVGGAATVEQGALEDEVEGLIREASAGRIAHARSAISDQRGSGATEAVAIVLERVYDAHASGLDASDVLDLLLDGVERWLTPSRAAYVDEVFDSIDLERAPASAGVVLLATTRLTREHFSRRDAFTRRFERWLIGRDGRTEAQVRDLLSGLVA